MDILIFRDGEQLGPYTEHDVQGYLRDGSLVASDLAWLEGASDWTPLSSLPQFAQYAPRAAAPTPPERPSAAPVQPDSVDLPALPTSSLGSYAASTLQPGERALHKTTLHWIILLRGVMSALIVTTLWVGASYLIPLEEGLGSMGAPLLRWVVGLFCVFRVIPPIITFLTSEFVITDKRIIVKVGFIRRRTVETFISKIESVSVYQGITGRLFDFGTVILKGTGGSAEPFADIARPIQLRNFIQRIQSHHESRIYAKSTNYA